VLLNNSEISNNSMIIRRQQHPFHVLGLSAIPIIMATCAGILALTFIAKIQNVPNISYGYFYNFNNMIVEDMDSRLVQIIMLILIIL
jgi:hypothetical protein